MPSRFISRNVYATVGGRGLPAPIQLVRLARGRVRAMIVAPDEHRRDGDARAEIGRAR